MRKQVKEGGRESQRDWEEGTGEGEREREKGREGRREAALREREGRLCQLAH